MEYDDVIAALFQPSPPDARPAPTQQPSPARRLRDALEPIAMHSVWCRATNEAQAELGLDFMTGYVLGRSALLGRPEPGVVVAAFAVFEPSMVAAVYDDARAKCDRDRLWATRTESTVASLTEVLSGADVDAAADALQHAMSSAPRMGRPLYSGLVDQDWPTSSVGRLWRACELAREHRGDSHVAVCVVHDLSPVEMNILTELWVGMPLASYTATRGWSPEAITSAVAGLEARGWVEGGLLTAAGIEFRSQVEQETDQLEQPIVEAIGGDFDTIVSDLESWSQRCIEAKAFPPDVFKRAAG